MRTLLDTCVISEIAKPRPDARVVALISSLRSDDMYISAITIGELTKGVALLAEGRRKRELSDWLVNLQQQFEDQILSVDKEIGRIWGELAARAQSNGAAIAPTDGLIAATALRHGHQVATRNVNHFAATGAAILNPWEHEIYSD